MADPEYLEMSETQSLNDRKLNVKALGEVTVKKVSSSSKKIKKGKQTHTHK